MKRPTPRISSAPLLLKFSKYISFKPHTILRLRASTAGMSIAEPGLAIPPRSAPRKYVAIFALSMMFLLGKHAMFGHDPPMNFRSTTATRFPSLANVHAASVDPVPSPRITRSYCSGCVF